MITQFRKPKAARRIEERSRARRLGVRVRVAEPGRRYMSHSQTYPDVIYHLEKSPEGWTCDCEGYSYTGVCKHLAALERRAEREGWNFDRIAPVNPITPATRLDLVDARLYA